MTGIESDSVIASTRMRLARVKKSIRERIETLRKKQEDEGKKSEKKSYSKSSEGL